jgi:hypothetical protein
MRVVLGARGRGLGGLAQDDDSKGRQGGQRHHSESEQSFHGFS